MTASEAARSWIFDPQRDETSHRSALTSGHRTMLVTVEELTALLESRETAERERARVAMLKILEDQPYPPPAQLSEATRLSWEACAECKGNRERKWPPSGLCNDHYCAFDREMWGPDKEAARMRPYLEADRVRDIARTFLKSLPPLGAEVGK